MPIFGFSTKSLLKVVLCFGITTTLASCEWQRCQVVGRILFVRNPSQLENISICSTIEAIRSFEIVDSVIKELNLKNNGNQILSQAEFLKELKIEAIPDTEVIEIYYNNSNQQLSIAIINSLIKNYIQTDSLKIKNKAATLANLLTYKISQKQQEVKAAQQALREVHEQIYKQTDKENEKFIKLRENLEKLNTEYVGLVKKLQAASVTQNQSTSNVKVISLPQNSCDNFHLINFLRLGTNKCN